VSSRTDGGSPRFHKGDRVESNFKGRGKWYPARVGTVHRSRTKGEKTTYVDHRVDRGYSIVFFVFYILLQQPCSNPSPVCTFTNT